MPNTAIMLSSSLSTNVNLIITKQDKLINLNEFTLVVYPNQKSSLKTMSAHCIHIFIISMILFSTFVIASHQVSSGYPIIWRKSNHHLATQVVQAEVTVKLQNPCNIVDISETFFFHESARFHSPIFIWSFQTQ